MNPARTIAIGCMVVLSCLVFFFPMRGRTQANSPSPLVWETNGPVRRTAMTVPPNPPGFRLVAPAMTGLFFTNWLSMDRYLTNQILLNGSGVAAGDVDGDGWCDLYFCGLDRSNALFRNLSGWKFHDTTREAGVGMDGTDSTGAAFADVDGDGDLDLLVNTVSSGTVLFLNDGRGHFRESGQRLNPGLSGTSLALADAEGDGDLDLYIANYRSVTIRDQPNTRFSLRTIDGQPQVVSVDGRPVSDPDLADRFVFHVSGQDGRGRFAYEENGEPDVFLRNDGAGRFVPVAPADSMFLDEEGKPLAKAPLDWGLSVMFRDLNRDGAPDLYVCNDFKSPDRIWMNDGRGRFRALSPLALRQTCLSSMGMDVADLNRDGFDDLFVVDMLSRDHVFRMSQRIDIKPEALPLGAIENRPQYPRNMLYLGRGDGTWAECAQLSGLEASEWSWTPVFLDVDLDGYEDLLISNGFERDGMNADVLRQIEARKKEKTLSSLEQLQLRKLFPRLDTGNLAFRNLGDLKFQDVSVQWGFDLRGISHGMCLADLDNDGDLDVAINNLNAAASLYRNEAGGPRVAVRLKGLAPNTRGIGARIKVTGGPVSQTQEMICGGRYLSSDEAIRVFAAGALTNQLTIEVVWRSGKRSLVADVRANYIYEIDERPAVASSPITNRPLAHFEDVSSLLAHQHHEEFFDDFAVQPTLPHRLSQLGPGVSWFDVDGDGWDDLMIGSGRNGKVAVFRNNRAGGFTRMSEAPLAQAITRDQTAVLGWRREDDTVVLLAGSANYEDGLTNGSVVRQFDLAGKAIRDQLPGQGSSTGPLAMADVDGDGRLDLFVGGRVVHGRYPAPASSLLFLGRSGGFELDRGNSAAFANVGLVSGAVFTDLDGDADSDLVLACDWGPLRFFRNERGRFAPWDWKLAWDGSGSLDARVNQIANLSALTGCWNGVTAADFDGDGRLDLAASNWGRNTRYESFRARPVRMFHGDLMNDGVHHVVEGYVDAATERLLPLQPFHVMGLAMPAMRERVGGFGNYARAGLPEIYGDAWKRMRELQVVCLESMVFLNRGDHLQAVVLPLEAQMSPAFGICAGDLDGDGREDLFLSQNFFAVAPDISRLDSGRGLWLRGDGEGGFAAVPGQESGLLIHGEQRGAALSDYDGDGRLDLAVGQNGAETRLFRNRVAKPGLRVRLAGPPGNPSGIGAWLRMVAGGVSGPVRELHAGAGYWSQDGAVQVMSTTQSASQLWVRWPNGRAFTTDLPAAAREVTLNGEGKIVQSR